MLWINERWHNINEEFQSAFDLVRQQYVVIKRLMQMVSILSKTFRA